MAISYAGQISTSLVETNLFARTHSQFVLYFQSLERIGKDLHWGRGARADILSDGQYHCNRCIKGSSAKKRDQQNNNTVKMRTYNTDCLQKPCFVVEKTEGRLHGCLSVFIQSVP